MCKLWIDVCVFITLVQTQFISGDLSIDQKIREGRQRELGVRLVGGDSSLEGRIEIWYNNTWGTVCDDRFDSKEAAVVCHMLGYERFGAMPYMKAAYGQGYGPIWVDELQCQGNEMSVRDCLHSPWGLHDCWHREDAGVKCRTKKNDDRNRLITVELDLVVEETEKHKIFNRYKSYRKNAVKEASKRWKDNTIYYVFGDGIDINKAHLIRDVLDEWSDYSCIDFSKSVSNDNYNQIVFISKQGDERCGSTYVGMKPGSQEINLGKDCFKRDIILHEVGHALGFYHEHNRADRDSYIKIHYENIEQGNEDSFKKLKQNEYEDYDKPYDYKSIMHYGQYFFSKNERITIETLKPEYQDVIGKARHPSFLDYKILNTMYECSARCGDFKCPDDGFLGKNCHCYCEEDEDDKSIRPCLKKKNCLNPLINSYLFEVVDERNKTLVDISYINHYPDKTVLNIFSTNTDCTLASQLQCDKGTWKGNIQDCPVQLELQFVDGSDSEGIVEVKLNGDDGFIGYICDDDWDDNDATVACRMMGFEFGKARFEHSYKGNESLPILLDDVKCSGSESTLSECKHSDWGKHDCAYTEVAAIECFDNRHTKHIDVLSNYDCGKIPRKGLKRKKRQNRILGGVETIKGMIPWQVRIERKKLREDGLRRRWDHWCGGTLISSHWILSAAHCFNDLKDDLKRQKVNYEDFRVYVGDHSRTKPDVYKQRFDIEYVVKHWQYSEIEGEDHPGPSDIALLKIKSKSGDGTVFNDYVQPACLPGKNDPLNYGMQCEVSGWGRLSEEGEVIPDKLMSVEVRIVNESKCKEFYDDSRSKIDLQRMFCAGENGADTCNGDSGGPLSCDMNDIYTVTGITSWGRGCGRPDAPGVYTNVAAYVSWIKEQISRHDSVGCKLSDDQRYRYEDSGGSEIKPGSNIPDGTTLTVTCTTSDRYEYYINYDYDYDSESTPDLLITCADNTLSQFVLDCPEVGAESCTELDNGYVREDNGYYMVSCDKGYSLNLIIPERTQCTCENGKLKSVYGNQEPACIPDNCVVPDDIDWRLSVTDSTNRVSLSRGSVVEVGEFVYFNCSRANEPIYEPLNRRFICSNGLWIEAERDSNWKLGYNGYFPSCRKAICVPSCANDGVCFKDDMCRCKHLTEGRRCENVICDHKCLINGGTCVGPGECACPQGKFGNSCELEGCKLPTYAAQYKHDRTVFTPGEILTDFTCADGFILSSRDGMICQDGGVWSDIVKCVEAVVYLISVRTVDGWRRGAGTDANVYITLSGLRGETDRIYLTGAFEPDDLDETRVKAKDVRPITSVVIGHDGSGWSPDWHLEYVSIYVENMEEYYVFRHNGWVKAENDVRLPRQGLDQQTCIDSFDSGHKWWPRWSVISSKKTYNIGEGSRMSLRVCKQACINLQAMQCKAVLYDNYRESCSGFAVSDTSYFSERHGRWSSPVYLRTCKQFD